MGLGKIFSDFQKKRADEKHRDQNYADALKAIEARDLIALQKTLAVTFDWRQENELLAKAILSNDAAIFGAVLKSMGNDPNRVFFTHIFDNENFRQETLLYHAIDLQKQQIALYLLKDSRTNVTFSGMVARSIARNKQGGEDIKQPYEKSVLELAREKNMPAVTAAVLERVVKIRAYELEKLKDELSEARRVIAPRNNPPQGATRS